MAGSIHSNYVSSMNKQYIGLLLENYPGRMTDPSGTKFDSIPTNDDHDDDRYDDDTDNHYVVAATTTTSATNVGRTMHPNLATTSTTIPIPTRLFGWNLPDGRMIDGKNTLHSFDTPDPVVRHTPDSPMIQKSSSRRQIPPNPAGMLWLPDRRIINGKNTLQSFDVSSHFLRQKGVGEEMVETPGDTDPSVPLPPNIENLHPNANTDDAAVHAEAVAVVDAEIVNEQIPVIHQPMNHNPRIATFWSTLACTGMILVGVITGVGVYCGTGNCGSTTETERSQNTGSDSNVMFPSPMTKSPMTMTRIPSPSPVVFPSLLPSVTPTNQPTKNPTKNPTISPATNDPTVNPTSIPTANPTRILTPSPIRIQTSSTITRISTPDPTPSPVAATDIPVATSDPVATVTTSPPTTDTLLVIACDFFFINSLTDCRSTTNLIDALTRGDTIPSEIGLLTQLTALSVPFTGLSGTIPSTMGNLVRLTQLGLSYNQLSGTIPSTLGNLSQLRSLHLNNNAQLSGPLPASLCSLPGIEINADYEVCS